MKRAQMVLTIDVGNTNITFGVFEGDEVRATFRMMSQMAHTSDEYGILIVAMLITPAATAYLYVNSLKSMILLSSTLGAVTSVLGLFLGTSFNVAAGSSIVLTSAVIFAISFFISPKQQFFRKWVLRK